MRSAPPASASAPPARATPSRDGTAFDGAAFDGAAFDGAAFDGAAFDGAAFDGAGLDGAGLDGVLASLLGRVRLTEEEPAAASEEVAGSLEQAAALAVADLVPAAAAGLDPDDADAAHLNQVDRALGMLPWELLAEYADGTADPEGPEFFKAGFWDRSFGDGVGFASGGAADQMLPGPALTQFAADAWAAGLDARCDDEVIGVLRAARRLGSWAAALEMTAAGDLIRRRLAEQAAGQSRVAEHASDEIAAALTLTGRSAGLLADRAMALNGLPATMRALSRGDIDLPRALVIADETTGLPEVAARAVDAAMAPLAGEMTTGELRAAVRRAVLVADPDRAKQRKEESKRDARVERWGEPGGTAGLAGRDLDPVGALAADRRLTAIARQLQDSGADGTIDNLRALAFLALLTGQDPAALTASEPQPSEPQPSEPQPSEPQPSAAPGSGAGHERDRADADRGREGATAAAESPSAGAGRAPNRADHPASSGHGPDGLADRRAARPTAGPNAGGDSRFGLTGTVNLTMPLATWLGWSSAPGEVSGQGVFDAADSRALAGLLAHDSRTHWCVTLTDTAGHALAHGCARGAPPSGPPRQPPRGHAPHGPAPHGPAPQGPAPPGRAEPGMTTSMAAWLSGISITPLARGDCDHSHETPSYRPSARLRHLIRTRQRACSFPGCRRPAICGDLDHSIPWAEGGRTCECNLAPLCRRHHRAKQAKGWRLEQPEPGVILWTTPSGRTYRTGPTAYSGS